MHFNCQLLFERYAKERFRTGARVIEIGPDGHPSTLQTSVGEASIRWETVDLDAAVSDRSRITYLARTEYEFPVPDGTFDVVVSANVIEHAGKIWVWIKEVGRICKPGGTVITINPVSWPFHEAPIDCWRIYPEGMRTLYAEAGLGVDLCRSESLELPPGLRRSYPGATRHPGWATKVKQRIGWPISYAVDTITIGTKPI